MSEERPFDQDEIETEELDLDGEQASIEDAMQEALKAVERGGGEDGEESPFGAGASDELTALRAEVEELRDKSMRTLADFDNFRKRIDRERSRQRQYAGFEVLRDFLQVVDNLERALGAEGEVEELRQGVELILKQMEDLLKQNGVERVVAEGRFDPVAQEAVVRHESDEVTEPTVVKELQAGYRMRDRLLRPAMVEVAVPMSATDEEPEAEA